MGLAIAGLVWCSAIVVAAVVAAGPAGSATCADDGVERTTVTARLQFVPFGPTCVHERIDPFGEPYDEVEVDPPEPVWRTALAAGALTGVIGLGGVIATRRPDVIDLTDDDPDHEHPDGDREPEPVGGGSGVNRHR
jgi:hypothetical protein